MKLTNGVIKVVMLEWEVTRLPWITLGFGNLRTLGAPLGVRDRGRLTPPSYSFCTSSKPLNSLPVVFKYKDRSNGSTLSPKVLVPS